MAKSSRRCKRICRNWTELPEKATASILSRLGAIEILESAQKVCMKWRKLCKDPFMWSKIDMRNDGEINYDLEEMCRYAVDRSSSNLVDINVEYFGTDALLEYITGRTVLWLLNTLGGRVHDAKRKADDFVGVRSVYKVKGALKQDSPNSSRAVIAKPTDENEEFAHMMARMDELEKEEREAESQITQSDEDEQVQHGLHQLSDQKSLHGNLKISEVTTKAMQQTNFIHKAPKKIFEAPLLPLPKRSTAKLPEFHAVWFNSYGVSALNCVWSTPLAF